MPQGKIVLMDLARELGQLGDWAVDLRSGHFTSSREAAAILDMPHDCELSSWDALERFCTNEYRGRLSGSWQECIRNGALLNMAVEALTHSGRRIWLRIVARPLFDEAGEISGVQGALQDITPSKLAERKLLDSEQEFRRFADSMPHVIWTATADGCLDYVNDAYTRYTGLALDKTGESWISALHPEDVERCLEEWQRAVENGTSFAIEYRLFNQALGMHCWHAVRAEPVRDAHGTLSKWYGIATDIHDHKILSEKFTQLGARLNATFESMSEGFYILSRDWKFTYLNTAAEYFLQRNGSRLLGKVVWEEFPLIAGTPLENALKTAADSLMPSRLEYFYPPLECWFSVNIHPNDEGVSVFFQDISEQKTAALSLERTTRALRLLSSCNSALIRCESEDALLDEICRIALENGGYQAAFVALQDDSPANGLRLAAHACTAIESGIDPFQEHWNISSSEDCCPLQQAMRSGQPVLVEDLADYTASWRLHIKQCGLVSGVCLPLRDRRKTFGVLTFWQREKGATFQADITLLRELADNLAYGIASLRAEERHRQEQNAIVKLAASTSASSGRAFFEQLARNMGEALGAHASFVARILPESPPRARTLAAVVDGQSIENFDYLIKGSPCEQLAHDALCIVPDDVARRFPASTSLAALGARAYVGHRLDNATGEPVGFLFVLYRRHLARTNFITSTLKIFADRAAAELEREQTQARLRDQASLLDKAHDAIIVHDLDHRISFWNRSAQRLYGWTEREALGHSIPGLMSHDEADFRRAFEQALENGEWVGEYLCRRKDGSALTVEASWTLVRDQYGAPQSIFTIETDISARKTMEKELLHQARHDILTGLPNRAYFYEQLEQAMKRSRRRDSWLGLLYFDIDKFKQINDNHGHDIGDEVIRTFAEWIRNAVREADFMSRLGGDEFVLLLEDLSAPDCTEIVAAKLTAAMQAEFVVKGLHLQVSTSIGIALYKPDMSVDELVRQADQAMYRAKRAGRNCFRY
ncbi:putative diguanylate cyclase YegE [compost metagenome]